MSFVTVADVMARHPASARATTPLRDVAHAMRDHHLSALPVVDDRGLVIGVVNEVDVPLLAYPDLSWRATSRNAPPARPHMGITARVMNRRPPTISPEAHLKEATVIMARHAVKSLPVVDPEGRLIGMVGLGQDLHPRLRQIGEVA